MSTLDGPIWSKYSTELTCPPRSHFQRTLSKERWARVGMNVTAHQEKNEEIETGLKKAGKNEKTETGMKKTREGRRQVTDFREAKCCPSAVVRGAAQQKNSLRGVPEVTGTLGKTNSHFDPTQTGSGPHHHVEAAVD